MRRLPTIAGMVLCLAAICAAPARATNEARPDAMRVLFIGNSYTRFNDLPGMVEDMARSVSDGPLIVSTRITQQGATVRRHWVRRRARATVEHGGFDAVVLQGHSMAIQHPAEMREYTGRFADSAHLVGARVVLFETWPRRDGNVLYRQGEAGTCAQDMLLEIDRLYGELASCVGASLSPVGRAWMRALERRPDARLHAQDGTHPTIEGTYLSALVLYGTLTARDPRQVTFRHWQISPAVASELRTVASDTLRRL